MSVVTVLLAVSAGLLVVSALMVTARITRGPTMLDRAISFDVLVVISITGVILDAAYRRNAENLPLVLVATLLGFVGSVSVARYSPGSDDVEADDGGAPEDAADDDDPDRTVEERADGSAGGLR